MSKFTAWSPDVITSSIMIQLCFDQARLVISSHQEVRILVWLMALWSANEIAIEIIDVMIVDGHGDMKREANAAMGRRRRGRNAGPDGGGGGKRRGRRLVQPPYGLRQRHARSEDVPYSDKDERQRRIAAADWGEGDSGDECDADRAVLPTSEEERRALPLSATIAVAECSEKYLVSTGWLLSYVSSLLITVLGMLRTYAMSVAAYIMTDYITSSLFVGASGIMKATISLVLAHSMVNAVGGARAFIASAVRRQFLGMD